MSGRKEALTDMLSKVEAGDGKGFRKANRAVFSTPCQDMDMQLREEHSRHAYNGSLDAAKALHEAVLPGWDWSVGKSSTYVVKDGFGSFGFGELFDEPLSMDPARAWLIAIIKALIAEEDNES